jgi:hypothetical protein
MPDRSDPTVPVPPWWRAILGDAQFWIPLTMLVAGLLLLRWVA